MTKPKKSIDERIAELQEKKRKQEQARLMKLGKLVEKYAGKITDETAFEKYLSTYGYAVKKTQGGAEKAGSSTN